MMKFEQKFRLIYLLLNRLINEMMNAKFPKNESEFNELMEEIDSSLKEQNIPITARGLLAMREIFKLTGFSSKIPHNGKAIPGNYEGDNLTVHVEKWFKDRYGDRTRWKKNMNKMNMGLILLSYSVNSEAPRE